jgi:hypothetical protein
MTIFAFGSSRDDKWPRAISFMIYCSYSSMSCPDYQKLDFQTTDSFSKDVKSKTFIEVQETDRELKMTNRSGFRLNYVFPSN